MPFLNEVETPTPKCAFEKLVQDLGDALAPNSGLDSDNVDPKDIQRLMENYVSNSDEWTPYAPGDATRAYTRNLIDEGNRKSNLLILVWSPGKGSAIHDHVSHSVMKILKGKLQEDLYSWPDQKKIAKGEDSPPQLTKQTVYGENEVTYMSDTLGLHRISNPDPNDFAVSLHLYTPPNNALSGFSIFDERTGEARHIKQSNYYSFQGLRYDDILPSALRS